MSARLEFGKNFLEITNFKHFFEVGGSQYNTLFDLRVQSCNGKFVGSATVRTILKASDSLRTNCRRCII